MRDLAGENERISVELSKEELEDLIGQLRTGKRLHPGHPRQQRLLAKLRGFGPQQGTAEESTVCPLERWLEENDYPTAAMTTFQAEALVSHVARYLEHISVCPVEDDEEEAEED